MWVSPVTSSYLIPLSVYIFQTEYNITINSPVIYSQINTCNERTVVHRMYREQVFDMNRKINTNNVN